MDTPGNGAESKTKNLFREEGDAESDPANVSGSDTDYLGAKKRKRRGERTQYIHQKLWKENAMW